jgi:alkylated DNA repair protein (DNA oxidative demethylase)
MNLADPVGQLTPEQQATMVEEVRAVISEAPLVRPTTPNGLPMRVRVSAAGALGWVGDGAYRYSATQRDGRPWPPMPASWRSLASKYAGSDQPWDSAVINWYEPGASLGWHTDGAEADTSLPIVTFSLGDSCSWAVSDEQGNNHRARLETGAVTLLAARTRNLAHTVERIIAAPLFSPLKTRGRISVTVRVAGGVR